MRSPTRWARCARRSPSRWRATPKARPSSCASSSPGARSDADAVIAARAIAASQLVQCSLYGGDPYWGRVLSEIGASGAFCDPERVDIDYGGVTVCRDGIACAHDAAALAAVMAAPELTVHSELHLGHGEATVLTTDLSPGLHRREHEDVVSRRGVDPHRGAGPARRRRAPRPRSSPTRCRTSASSRARSSSSSTAATRWTIPRSPSSSRPMSCSCGWSGCTPWSCTVAARRSPTSCAGSARSPSSSTAGASPTPRPSTSSAWRSSAR